MNVDFLYGKEGRTLDLPDDLDITVALPEEETVIADPIQSIYDTLNNPMSSKPLKKLLEKRKDGDIVIVIEDNTRPMPTKYPLKALFKLFEELNIEDDEVKILVAAGLHRPPTSEELERMIGDEIRGRFDVIFHDANDDSNLEMVGKTKYGNEVYLNSVYVNAGFKIITGYVEPHFFAGFSGGRKSLVPGIAAKDTILRNHSPKNIDSGAKFGVLKGNLVHEDALETARMPKAKPDFCINVTINSNHEITNIASGNIIAVHNYLVQSQKKVCFTEMDKLYDIVVCGNGGYPLDLNLYQAVKSMAIGEMGAMKGGSIISVNQCSDGVGQEQFDKLLNCGKTARQIYDDALSGVIKVPDVWEIQILARILIDYEITVVSDMKEQELGNIGLKYAQSVRCAIEKTIEEKKLKRESVSILVLPKGPLLLPVYNP